MPNDEIFQEDYTTNFSGKEKEALEHALDIRKYEIELYWKRATYFWTFIAATLAGFVAVQSLGGNKHQDLSVILACLGLVFSFAWVLVNRGSKFWQENWKKHVDLLEDKVTGPLYKTVLSRNSPKNKKELAIHMATGASEISVSKINHLVSIYTFLLWVIILVYSLWPIHHSLPINWFYVLVVSLSLAACYSFHKLGRTYKGGYIPTAKLRTSKLKANNQIQTPESGAAD